MTADNGWWWEQAAQQVLAIQRCTSCETLRHPPRPMCNRCRSLQWDFIAASGRGTLASYTVLEHPQFPGYQYPIAIALVELEEGERITAQLVGIEPDDITFGMPLQVSFQADPDGFVLPVFEPAEEN